MEAWLDALKRNLDMVRKGYKIEMLEQDNGSPKGEQTASSSSPPSPGKKRHQGRRGSHWERGVEKTGSAAGTLLKKGYLTLESKSDGPLKRWFVLEKGRLTQYPSEQREKQMTNSSTHAGGEGSRNLTKSGSMGRARSTSLGSFRSVKVETFELTMTTKLGVFQSTKVKDVPIFLVSMQACD